MRTPFADSKKIPDKPLTISWRNETQSFIVSHLPSIGVILFTGKQTTVGFGYRARDMTQTALPKLQKLKVGTDRRTEPQATSPTVRFRWVWIKRGKMLQAPPKKDSHTLRFILLVGTWLKLDNNFHPNFQKCQGSSVVEQETHKLLAVGSNPTPATNVTQEASES